MVEFIFGKKFQNTFSKLKEDIIKKRIINQLKKIESNSEAGKPMMHNRRGTRELYLKPFRLSYVYNKNENKIYVMDLYHKKKQ